MKPLAFVSVLAMVSAALAATESRTDIESYLKQHALPLETAADLDPLLERIGDARIVLLGEASHGTAEYYTWRAEISKRLIAEKGFDFIAVEGDWPSCYQVNRYIKTLPDAPPSAAAALASFQRWPPWMWNNQQTADLVEWLADHNADRPTDQKAGFFGIDVYSLPESMDSVLAYARKHAPHLKDDLKSAYDCFSPFRDDLHGYARLTATGQHCGDRTAAVVALLDEHADALRADDPAAFFDAKQNAYVVKRAEMHYRAMADPQANSWNKRAEHMKHTLTRLLDEHGPASRGIVWAHNTHIGDARATDMATVGMKNIGWLARQTYGTDQVVAVGFTTHRGQVLAGRQWGAAMETMTVPPAMRGSVEELFNSLGKDRLMVIFDDDVPAALQAPLGHRAKGVTYNPQAEQRNYVPTILPQRYDAFIFFAETGPLTVPATDRAKNVASESTEDDNRQSRTIMPVRFVPMTRIEDNGD